MLPTTLLHFKSKTSITDFNNGYLSKINEIEDLLRAFSLVLPGRVKDGDLCSQAILTVLNLVSLVNTHLLYKSANKKNTTLKKNNNNEKELIEVNEEDGKESFLFNHHLHVQSRVNILYRYSATLLSIVSYSEIILEMIIARKWNTKKKWQFISCIEGLKMLLRLILFYTNKKKMILHPTHYIRNINPENLEFDKEEKFELTHLDPRIGLPSSGNETLYNNHQLISDSMSSSSSSSLTPTLKKLSQLAELLWIIRPFVYVILLKRAHDTNVSSKDNKEEEKKKNEKEIGSDQENEEEIDIDEKEEENYWQPWVISLVVDIGSMVLRSISLDGPLEKEEHKRRLYLLLYYFFRGPLYSQYTSKLLEWICDATEHRPLISILTTAINDYKPFWQQCYFYTAGS